MSIRRNPRSGTLMHCPITQKSIIQISGEDSQKFLQSQLTANLDELEIGTSQFACQCNAKGKTLAIFHVIAFPEKYLLITDSGCVENSLRELKKYAVFSKVVIDDVSDQYQLIGVSGDELPESVTPLPSTHLQSTICNNSAVTRFDVPESRWLFLLENDAPEITELQKQAIMSENEWDIMDIQAGIPKLAQAQSEEYVPQMMNLQALNAISFNKGCYMGQEVVARTKYLGKNKRAGAILLSESEVNIESGDTFELQLGENWRRIGTCLYGASAHGKTWAFAVTPNDLEADSNIRLQNHPEAVFTLQKLPYVLD
ncbi:tRNA-modifying protein YgfZ [Alteromonas sp. a30]|uniref:tRNA-modifying protein YgfZ n=1 Tax=Alteromonas sp. a30 TaxID=2730917 RepID=UPI00228127E2|nr:tRNA-modifying protein YgfZ [Alteromonas sp. a30]MCY7296614.1 tRNA-modifying protein YgfZ [Alteromonas sp. a30]